MLYFATYFDINYLSRGLVLYHSLKAHSVQSFTLFVFALDNETVEYFHDNATEHITVIPIHQLEDHFPELQQVKKNRSKVEYYFTLSPFLPLYIFDVFKAVDQITTLDADICFFSDPATIFNTYSQASVLITSHRFPAKLKPLEKYGLYNVSFQSFKRDNNALACLEDWKQQCTNWCFDHLDEKNDRFADQKYLDAWTSRFNNVYPIGLPQAGLAPWNFENGELSVRDKRFFVNGAPLIFFHFHGLRILNDHFALANLHLYQAKATAPVKKLYHRYIKMLKATAGGSLSDNKIIRMRQKQVSLFKTLLQANEFLYFNVLVIYSLKWRPWYLRYLNLVNKLNGSVNRSENVYR